MTLLVRTSSNLPDRQTEQDSIAVTQLPESGVLQGPRTKTTVLVRTTSNLPRQNKKKKKNVKSRLVKTQQAEKL
jgi:hypothetical protein